MEAKKMNKGWISNSLSIERGMGLDQILKRAIEKVREKKAEELYGKEEGSDRYQEDSLEKKNERQKNRSTDKKIITSANTLSSEQQSPDPFKEKTSSPFPQPCNCQGSSSLSQSQTQIDSLTSQLQTERLKVQSLQLQIRKLKKEINDEMSYSNDLETQRQELLSQIRELEKMTEMKEAQIKKERDQANFWRNQHQLVLSKYQILKKEKGEESERVQQLEKELREMKEEREKVGESGIERGELAKLQEENKMAKQYLYDLTLKLYAYEQEIIKLKGKNSSEQPDQQINSKLQQETSRTKGEEQPRRKRQFSRQRSLNGRIDRIAEQQVHSKHEKTSQITSVHQLKSFEKGPQNDMDREARIASLQRQLLQLQDSKVLNGRIRRRKIQLERQLQQYGSLHELTP